MSTKNSQEICKQNQTLIGLYFLENVFHRSKFKACSHDGFFSWTFDLLLINSRYLIIQFISHHTKEIPMGNQSWNKNHEFVSDIDVQKTCFFFSKIIFNFSQFQEHIFKSSYLQMFIKIGVLKSFPNFTGKHLSLFLKSLQAEGLQISLKSLQHRCFPVKFSF